MMAVYDLALALAQRIRRPSRDVVDTSVEDEEPQEGLPLVDAGDQGAPDPPVAAVIDERTFAAGIRRSSSPRPGRSSCNQPGGMRTGVHLGSTCTDNFVYAMDTSTDSSDLPDFNCIQPPEGAMPDEPVAQGAGAQVNDGFVEVIGNDTHNPCMSPILIDSSHNQG